MSAENLARLPSPWDARGLAKYIFVILGLAVAYFVLGKLGLALASINSNVSPIWPPSGLALAAVLLWGYRVWPAVFLGAIVVNATTAGSIYPAAGIALGNTLECLISGYLMNRWSQGRAAFETPTGVARFALISLGPGPILSATIGLFSLAISGFAEWRDFATIWLTWWLGDAAAALVITPVLVLWATRDAEALSPQRLQESAAVALVAALIGLIAFSPLIEQTVTRGPFAFLAILPLLWAALRRGPGDTATVALILSTFAIWGTLLDGGPFARATLNESFLLLLMFMISTAVPSLALSADVAMRKQAQDNLRRAHEELDQRVQQRTAELAAANSALQSEVEQRKSAEAEIRQQGMHMLEAQRIANLGSWVWEIPADKIAWSGQLCEIYGLEEGTIPGTFDAFIARIHEDDRVRVKEEITRAFKSGERFRVNERIVRPNGEVRHLQSSGEIVHDDQGNPVQMLGICQDVTERRNAEMALREREQTYRLIVESVRDYAIIMLDRQGHVVSWNAGAAHIKGYAAADIVGKHFSVFHTEEDRQTRVPDETLRRAKQDGKYESEGWRVRKDGTRFWAHAVIDAIYNEDGWLVGFAKITRDVTERREAQAALERAREQLAQAQKMEAIGQSAGGIAHDFNNLLMIVSGHAEMLRKRLTEPRDVRSIEAIQTAASRGESLTRQLLAFSRRQTLSPVVVDLRARIEALREMLGSSLRGNIELVCDISAGTWPTKVDQDELDLALVNIALNARDAMPDGGKIALSSRNASLRPGASVGQLNGDFVALSVTDTGTGIPPDVLPKIFDPFFTTKAIGKGTGLGLSQVYGFAHQSGGTVTVASEINRGTTMTIYLPRCDAPVSMPRPTAEQSKGARAEGTILVVEDNREVGNITTSLLEQIGYRVVRAENAPEALEMLRQDETIDAVFSDIVMPGGMNGIVLAQEIETRFPDVPVLLTSGYSDAVQAAENRFAILRKPFQAATLEQALRKLQNGGASKESKVVRFSKPVASAKTADR
jgi:PAS domain S-box-containing protein